MKRNCGEGKSRQLAKDVKAPTCLATHMSCLPMGSRLLEIPIHPHLLQLVIKLVRRVDQLAQSRRRVPRSAMLGPTSSARIRTPKYRGVTHHEESRMRMKALECRHKLPGEVLGVDILLVVEAFESEKLARGLVRSRCVGCMTGSTKGALNFRSDDRGLVAR